MSIFATLERRWVWRLEFYVFSRAVYGQASTHPPYPLETNFHYSSPAISYGKCWLGNFKMAAFLAEFLKWIFFLDSLSNYDMYRSLYNYQGRDRGALVVRAGEYFTFIEQHDANWWKMRSHTGSVGLVPACYLEPVDEGTVREIL